MKIVRAIFLNSKTGVHWHPSLSSSLTEYDPTGDREMVFPFPGGTLTHRVPSLRGQGQ